jgi:hypothetical protein
MQRGHAAQQATENIAAGNHPRCSAHTSTRPFSLTSLFREPVATRHDGHYTVVSWFAHDNGMVIEMTHIDRPLNKSQAFSTSEGSPCVSEMITHSYAAAMTALMKKSLLA